MHIIQNTYGGCCQFVSGRTPDRRPGFDARCHQTPSEYTRSTCSLNQWVRSLVGLIMSAGTGEYFPPLQSTCRNCGGGDRDRVAIYRPFGEFRRAKIVLSSICMVLKLNDRRISCPCHDEFRGPRSDFVRQVALENNNNDMHSNLIFSGTPLPLSINLALVLSAKLN
ncbi:uncharacterized protein TNCV_3909771 [Trichonephila clavipes]|nr:uncharacterized protein TNCV_3909771 [Trichonephila clavipes]